MKRNIKCDMMMLTEMEEIPTIYIQAVISRSYMEDKEIIELYFARDEAAIVETASKYGHYLTSVVYRILRNTHDTEEIVNDTYYNAWHLGNEITIALDKAKKELDDIEFADDHLERLKKKLQKLCKNLILKLVL